LSSHQTSLHFNIIIILVIGLALCSGNCIDSLNYIDTNFMPVSSLKSNEIDEEEKEVTCSCSDPCTEDWNFFKSWCIETKDKDTSW
jgi:hypothetical protein